MRVVSRSRPQVLLKSMCVVCRRSGRHTVTARHTADWASGSRALWPPLGSPTHTLTSSRPSSPGQEAGCRLQDKFHKIWKCHINCYGVNPVKVSRHWMQLPPVTISLAFKNRMTACVGVCLRAYMARFWQGTVMVTVVNCLTRRVNPISKPWPSPPYTEDRLSSCLLVWELTMCIGVRGFQDWFSPEIGHSFCLSWFLFSIALFEVSILYENLESCVFQA